MKRKTRRMGAGAPKGNKNRAGRGEVQTGKRPPKGKYFAVGCQWPEDDDTGHKAKAMLEELGIKTTNDFWRRYLR